MRLRWTKPSTSDTFSYNVSYGADDQEILNVIELFNDNNYGSYKISLFEITGQNRIVGYNDDQLITAASIYKLFVAYSTLLRVEDGRFSWSDYITPSKNLAKCFNDMLQYSDNVCAEELLEKISREAITSEAALIGSVNTSFVESGNIKTTSFDVANLLARLQMGYILNTQDNRDILINAMKSNIYRYGIPYGVGGVVADKVGFLEDYLHDAAIVYYGDNTYVLVVMTQGSSWYKIALLARKIQDAMY